jgi:hypothetical protein
MAQTAGLVGRDAELAELAEFAAEAVGTDNAWWHTEAGHGSQCQVRRAESHWCRCRLHLLTETQCGTGRATSDRCRGVTGAR